MKLTEWNARLHGLVIFRALLDDDVIAKFVDLTDRMAAAPRAREPCATLPLLSKQPSSSTPPISANTFPLPSSKPRRSVSGRRLSAKCRPFADCTGQ